MIAFLVALGTRHQAWPQPATAGLPDGLRNEPTRRLETVDMTGGRPQLRDAAVLVAGRLYRSSDFQALTAPLSRLAGCRPLTGSSRVVCYAPPRPTVPGVIGAPREFAVMDPATQVVHATAVYESAGSGLVLTPLVPGPSGQVAFGVMSTAQQEDPEQLWLFTSAALR